MNNIFLFTILLCLWFLMSGFFNPLFVFYGVTSCLIAVFFFNKMLKASKTGKSVHKTKLFSLRFFLYTLWLFKEVVISSFNVAIEMWREKPNTKPKLKWIKHNLKKDGSLAVYANSITLTPGTISMYATKKEMLVHALHEDGIADLEKGTMHDKIKRSLEK